MKSAFCYHSFPDKRRKYVAEVIPAIMSHAHAALPVWRRHTIPAPTVETLARLHDTLRELPYLPEDEAAELAEFCPTGRAIDVIRPVQVTLEHGGDCEDFAAVMLSALWAWGIPASLETAGDAVDPFRHVRVVAAVDGQVYVLDPKPDAEGMPFNERWAPELDVLQAWNYQPDEVAA